MHVHLQFLTYDNTHTCLYSSEKNMKRQSAELLPAQFCKVLEITCVYKLQLLCKFLFRKPFILLAYVF